jgi:DNA-nicking Smr family endonuclease
MTRERAGRRRLSADEKALWKTVTRAVKPLKPRKVDDEPDLAEPASGAATPPPPSAQAAVSPPSAKKQAPPLAPLERHMRRRLARGTDAIDRRIDLHGHTQREAHDALVHFLHAAQASGAKIVLVVTGKGARTADPDPYVERGVLRRLVPQWLHHPELRDIVVGFESASIVHGGEGALYVRLRRRRSATK